MDSCGVLGLNPLQSRYQNILSYSVEVRKVLLKDGTGSEKHMIHYIAKFPANVVNHTFSRSL